MGGKVVILIIHYGCVKLTKDCISSLTSLNYSNYCILLLDNSGTKQLSSDDYFKKITNLHLFYTNRNVGFAKGCNILVNKALFFKPSYLLFLNNDTQVRPDLLDQLVSSAKNSKAAGVLSCVITYLSKPQTIWFAGGYLNKAFLYTKHSFMNKNVSYLSNLPPLIRSDWITGCCMFIPYKIWQRVGPFDERYGSYVEDVDWCIQMTQKTKLHCLVINKALVAHAVSSAFGKEGSNTLTISRAYYFARNPILLILKHLSSSKRYLAIFGQLSIVLGYYMWCMLRTRQFKSMPAYVHGLWDGMRNLT